MTEVRVWSEVDPALKNYTDCTYCSILMVVAGSGFSAFPLGAYTHPERIAFRGGDARLNFSGGVDHAKARYGITIQSPIPYTQIGLRTVLATPGKAFAVAGKLANFPAGHPRRRHDPTFAGFHAVCVIPLGNGQVRWLDPLAPMGFAGDVIPVSEVTDIFCVGNYPNDARFLPVAQEDDMRITKGKPQDWVPVAADIALRAKPDRGDAVVERVAKLRSVAEVATDAPVPNNNWRLWFNAAGAARYALRADLKGVVPDGNDLVLIAQFAAFVAGQSLGYTQAQLDAAVAKAAMDAKVIALKAGANGAADAAAAFAASLPNP